MSPAGFINSYDHKSVKISMISYPPESLVIIPMTIATLPVVVRETETKNHIIIYIYIRFVVKTAN